MPPRPSAYLHAPRDRRLAGGGGAIAPARESASRTFSTLLGLLACTGLRISEALQLDLADWEPAQAVLTIRQS